MAYWFHRNPLKATSQVNFELKLIVSDSQAVQVCSEIRQSRNRLLDLLSDPNNDAATLTTAFERYLSFLHGLIVAPDEKGGESKLRYSARFRWTQSLMGNTPLAQQDAVFELVSICQNVGIWFMKHAAMIAGKDEINMDEAKEVHKCLRKAAGYFSAMQEKYVGSLLQKPVPGSDLDSSIVNAYISQCTAEAQEVTIARAIELKHAPSLISALANETSRMYSSGANYLSKLSSSKIAKWQKYFELKSTFYLAYAYCYAGENLLSQEKCGDAVRSLQESEKCYISAIKQCKDYISLKGAGVAAKPENHLFFRSLGPVIKRTLEKCERENGFIFHQKVPADPLPLEIKATYGLVSPEDFTLPPINSLWTPVAYAAFDSAKLNPNDPAFSKSAQKAEGEIPPVKEVNVHQTGKDPKNNSGCVVQ
ncbi:LOW QUALITY PROTEIN: BRO1 domain-containing protein BROX-like [Uloborus diversus]|uniref:LOW QUALITY PROTEIN: BRO1 domain-containing protein BROX-like n=1 Tax=Uloborus diversus TaxID=327109 RepID=UPI002409BD46|nr:LOW QUALITY PROTEIN: BRO1 domain-containing protein BROX-like [Uloborus diversus]